MIRLVTISFIYVLISCEKEVKLDPEFTESKIVVNGILKAGETPKIDISRSESILYGESKFASMPFLSNATAKLYDSNQNLLGIFVHDSAGIYLLPGVEIYSGQDYSLIVSCIGYDDVWASTHIPEQIEVLVVESQIKDELISYDIVLADNPSENNFYALTISQIGYYCQGPACSGSPNRTMCTQMLEVANIEPTISGDKCSQVFLFSDENFNGNTFIFNATQNFYDETDSTIIEITLKSLTEDYFKYKVTNEAYDEIQPDPFSQPVQVFTNIENGFGVFAGSSVFTNKIIY